MATGLAAVLTIAVGIIIVLFIYIRRQKKRSSEDHETTRRVLHETRLELNITNRQLAKYLTKFPKKVNEMTTIENFINETQNRKMKISSNQDTFGLNDLSLTPPQKSPPSPPPITESTESSSAIKTILSEQNIAEVLIKYNNKTYLNETEFYCELCTVDVDSVEDMLKHVREMHSDLLIKKENI